MRAILFSAILLGSLGACAQRGVIEYMPGSGEIGTVHGVFVATSRDVPTMDVEPRGERSNRLTFGYAEISVPPEHKPGNIEWPSHRPDPRKHFLLDSFEKHRNAHEFTAAVNRTLAHRPHNHRNIVLYVHGFNNRFSEGLYQVIQLQHDRADQDVSAHYSWPSLASPIGYTYDRDSMLFARDGLEQTISALLDTNAEEVVLVGHSMGGLLIMETLRQIAISGDRQTLRRLGGIVLVSPDIDVELFHQQAARIGPLPQPFLIVKSTRDTVLELSAKVNRQAERLGNIETIDALTDLNVTVVDISSFSDGQFDHTTAFASPTLLRVMSGMEKIADTLSNSAMQSVGPLSASVLAVHNATSVVLESTLPD